MTATLVVVNHRSAAMTADLVEHAGGEVDEIVVVDNPGPDDEVAAERAALRALAARRPTLHLVELDANVGFGAGANAGAAVATGDVLLVANPDITPDPGALTHLAAAARGTGVVGPRFRGPDGLLQRSAHRAEPGLVLTAYDLSPPIAGIAARLRPGWHPTLHGAAEHERALDASHLLGALLAVDTAAFRAVGGFDEGFFLYREETDLCRRLRDAGWKVRYDPVAGAVHVGGASTVDAWPQAARPIVLESHYRYLAKHRGRTVAALARVIGTVGAIIWFVRGRERSAARRSLRWHLTGRLPEGQR